MIYLKIYNQYNKIMSMPLKFFEILYLEKLNILYKIIYNTIRLKMLKKYYLRFE